MTHRSIAICMFAGVLAGCSSVAVIKDPDPGDTGIRYYRPKPYLLVTPADATGRMVKMKVEYLPDYSEEYSIHPKGKKPPQVQLQDGWNLVAVGGPAPPPKPEEPPSPPSAPMDPMKVPEFVVAAGNVPFGFYESVFDTAGGKKYLKGWRYIGLSPMGGGNPIGADPNAQRPGKGRNGAAGQCGPAGWGGGPDGTFPGMPPSAMGAGSSIPGPLYGMVFFNGVMTFRQLDEIANNMTCPQYVRPIPEPVKPAEVPVPQGTVTTPETKPPSSGTQTRPERPATNPATPPTPASNPSTSSSWGEPARPASAPADVKVARTSSSTSGKAKIPPPKVWDFSR